MHDGSVKPVVAPYCPPSHGPEHCAVDAPATLPYKPVGHPVHDPAPLKLYVPTAHITAVAVVDPSAHAYPAEHSPEHDESVKPVLFPNMPAAHGTHTRETSTYSPTPHTTEDIVEEGDADGVTDRVTDAVDVGDAVHDDDVVYVLDADDDGDPDTDADSDPDDEPVAVDVTVAVGDSDTDAIEVAVGDTVADDDAVTDGDSVTDAVSDTGGDAVTVRDSVTDGDSVTVDDGVTDGEADAREDSLAVVVTVADGDAVTDGVFVADADSVTVRDSVTDGDVVTDSVTVEETDAVTDDVQLMLAVQDSDAVIVGRYPVPAVDIDKPHKHTPKRHDEQSKRKCTANERANKQTKEHHRK